MMTDVKQSIYYYANWNSHAMLHELGCLKNSATTLLLDSSKINSSMYDVQKLKTTHNAYDYNHIMTFFPFV